MRVYELLADVDHYQALDIADGGLYDFAARFEGIPLHGKVNKPRLVPFLEELPKGDFPSLSGNVPVFSRRAVEALHDMLTPNGELLSVVAIMMNIHLQRHSSHNALTAECEGTL